MGLNLAQLGNSLGTALSDIGTYSAKAASQANAVSAQAQSAQGAFNQASANQANMLQDQTLQAQYGFNSAMMNAANEYNTNAWNTAASWNEEMWGKQARFNAEQAELNRQFNAEQAAIAREFSATEANKLRNWQTTMANTSYQRAMKDMAAAGLNPILAYSQGGANVPGGAAGSGIAASGTAASVGGAQMSSAQAQMASGGLLGAHSASESNYTGQMEYLSGTLGLISAVIGGLSSAADAAGGLGETGKAIMENVEDIMNPNERGPENLSELDPYVEKGINKAKDWITDKWNKLTGKPTSDSNTHQSNKYYNKMRMNNYNRFKGQTYG